MSLGPMHLRVALLCLLLPAAVAWAEETRADGQGSAARGTCGQADGHGQACPPETEEAADGDGKACPPEKEEADGAGDAEQGTGGAGLDAMASEKERRGLEGMGVPLVTYTTDFGVGYGAAGGMFIYAPGYTPYRHSLSGQFFRTTRGVENHLLRYDGPGLFAGTRVEARLHFKRELLAPYYGLGNLSSPDFRGDINDRRFNYDRTAPGLFARLRFHPLGEDHPLEPWVGYGLEFVRVHTYEGSVLAEQRPVGATGGREGQLSVGLLWDTRDEEAEPHSGGAEEVSLRVSSPVTGGTSPYAGVTLVERRFWSLSSRVVLAQRFTLDALFGQAPFYELANVGGLTSVEGLGGMTSVRGVPRNRYVGNTKLFSNTELRYHVLDFHVFGQRVSAGGLAFFDVGRVWSPGVPNGGPLAWHPGTGVGLRLWRRAAVLRVDYAVALEDLRQGLYVAMGHMF